MKLALVVFFLCLPINVFAGINYTPSRINSAHTLTSSEQLIIISGSGYNITLPACGNSNDGETFIFRSIAKSGTVCIFPAGNDTFEGGGGLCIAGTQSDTISCDGANHDWLGIAFW